MSNKMTVKDRLKTYRKHPGSFLVMLLVMLGALLTFSVLLFLIAYILINGIYCEGITEVTVEDMKYAREMGMTIKLLASSKRQGERLHAIVAPCLLYPEHPLYNVNGVFNSIFVHGNVLGDAMFYGSGAGKLPTASAVVADMIECRISGRTLYRELYRRKTSPTQRSDGFCRVK